MDVESRWRNAHGVAGFSLAGFSKLPHLGVAIQTLVSFLMGMGRVDRVHSQKGSMEPNKW